MREECRERIETILLLRILSELTAACQTKAKQRYDRHNICDWIEKRISFEQLAEEKTTQIKGFSFQPYIRPALSPVKKGSGIAVQTYSQYYTFRLSLL